MTEKVHEAGQAAFDGPPTGLAAQIAELEETVRSLNDLLTRFSSRLQESVDALRIEVRDKVGQTELVAIRKDLAKMGARIDDVLDEVGYGETLDVAKVPPAILEHAYQAILDDIVAELKRALGAHDSEHHIVHTLEQLRLRTSGSEFFHYRPQGHRIEVGLRKPLEKGFISARQVQMTFEELQRHLLEPIHTHHPRNFRALLKIKSQEFAVDRALNLARDAEQANAQAKALRERLDRLETQVSGALKDVQEFAGHLRETLGNVATRESVEALQMRVLGIEARLSSGGSKARSPTQLKDEERVLAALATAARTEAELLRELGVQEGLLKEVLSGLETRGLIRSSLRGRTTTYRLPEETDNA